MLVNNSLKIDPHSLGQSAYRTDSLPYEPGEREINLGLVSKIQLGIAFDKNIFINNLHGESTRFSHIFEQGSIADFS